MAIRMTQRLPEGIGAAEYDAVTEKLDPVGNPPKGMLVHSAGEQDGRFTVVDIWESAEDFQRFAEERLGPAVAEVMGDRAQEAEEPRIVELHNVQVP